jgi:MFS family permease
MTSSRIVGPALAGLLITTVGYGWAFLADGFSYIAVIAALWMIDTKELRRAPVTPRGKGQVREGLRYVRTVPDLWISLLMMGVVGTLAYNFQVVVPLLVKKTFDGTDATFTILFSVLSVGSLLGALWTARRTSISVRDVSIASLAFGISMIVMSFAPSLASLYPIGMVVGFTSVGFITASTAIVQVRADPTMRGRVLALQAIVFLGSTPIGGPILGAICDTWGARAGLVVGGFAGIAAAIFGTVAAKRAGATRAVLRDDVDAGLRVA